MHEIAVHGGYSDSRVLVGKVLSELPSLIIPGKTVVVCEPRIRKLFGTYFEGFPTIEIKGGEEGKNFSTIQSIWESLIKIEADRSWMLVGFGGGVTTDIAGFAASTFLRGIRFGFVATSLLAQVDASVGGKNGVNVGNFKNMAGIFRQPEFVLCDSESLASLPDEELSSGLAEAIKHGVIRDAAYFEMIESTIGQAIAKDPETLEAIVEGSVRIKAKVVGEDEEESSLRRILNFGHSFGHAVELAYGLRHGYAVSIGMCFAGNFASSRGIFDKAAQARMEALLRKAGLPTSIRELRNKPNAAKLIQAMRHDKKRESGDIRFVLPEALGRARIESIPIREIETAIEKECG